MNRERMFFILAEELERSENLPANASEHLADLRLGKRLGPGVEAVLRSMARVADEVSHG